MDILQKLIQKLNTTKNTKVIPISHCEFAYVDHESYKQPHPASEYFFQLNDISINLSISLKWALFGYYFLKSISNTIEDIKKSTSNLQNTLLQNKNTQIFYEDYKNHEIFIDDIFLKSDDDIIEELNKRYTDNTLYNENSKIFLKLKLNMEDYILLQNIFIPTLFFSEESDTE